MIGDPTGSVDGWDQIKSRSVTRTDDGGLNLKFIFDTLKKVNVKKFLSYPTNVEAISDCNWQMNLTDFTLKYKITSTETKN